MAYLAIAAVVAIPLSDVSEIEIETEIEIQSLSRQTKLAPPDLNINVGGARVGRFMGDQYGWLVGVSNTDPFEKKDAVIGGAEPKNEPMYKSHRFGKPAAGTVPWGYDIPVAEPGTYGCTVHFAETDTTAFGNGERVFDLSIQGNGTAITFKGIDVYKETKGGQFVVLTKTAPRVVVTRILKVRVAKSAASSHGAFIAGITCERTGNLPVGATPDSENVTSTPKVAVRNPISPSPSMIPVLPGLPVVDDVTEPATAAASPADVPSPIPSSDPSVVPAVAAVPTPDATNPVPSPSSTASTDALPVQDNDTSVEPEPSTSPAEAILADIAVETASEAATDEVQQPYNLVVTVPKGTNVDADLRDAVKRTMMTGSKVAIDKWAITSWSVAEAPVSTLALFAMADSDTNFAVTAVANVKKESLTSVNDDLVTYLQANEGTAELQKTHPGATIKLASPIEAQGVGRKAKKGNTSVIVAAVVGTCVGLLLIVAVIAFFAIQNHRKNEVNPTVFDEPPPPPLTDSDGEAPSSSAYSEADDDDSHGQGYDSVDYLDDDSTFTAATSQRGNPEYGVKLDKDTWGRGSS